MTAHRAAFGARTQGVTPRYVVAVLPAIAGAVVSLVSSPGIDGACGAALAVLTVAIAANDARRFMIPDALSLAGFGLGLLHATLLGRDIWLAAFAVALLRAAVVAALFWGVRIAYRGLRGREGLGFGDVKLAGVAGAWLGWVMVPVAIEMAALSAIAFFVLRQHDRNRRVRANSRIPFGAFFAPAIWLAWLVGTVMPGRF